MKIPLLLVSLLMAVSCLRAQDFADPSSFIRPAAKPIEIQGKIQSATTNKPGWYGVTIDLGNGKALHVIVSPATKFWGPDPGKPNGFPYTSMAPEQAHSKIAAGQMIRAMHKLDMDEALHLVWISDLLFVDK